jgi:hypothetical protein
MHVLCSSTLLNLSLCFCFVNFYHLLTTVCVSLTLQRNMKICKNTNKRIWMINWNPLRESSCMKNFLMTALTFQKMVKLCFHLTIIFKYYYVISKINGKLVCMKMSLIWLSWMNFRLKNLICIKTLGLVCNSYQLSMCWNK